MPLEPRLARDGERPAAVGEKLKAEAAGLTEKAAASLVRKVRKSGWQPALAAAFIQDHAAGAHQQDYLALWNGFVQEAEKTLLSDMDYQMHDALALLRRECSVAGG